VIVKVLGGAVCACIVAALVGCGGTKGVSSAQSQLERGRYLVTTMGCNDCHTPWKLGPNGPEPDMTRMLSGHPESVVITQSPAPGQPPWLIVGSGTMTAWAGPWGVSFAANLTPDEETGIGSWTEANFVQAMRTGKLMGGGRPILPPMPWMWYGKMSDQDLKAMFAYLKSIPPIKNRVPDPVPPAGIPAHSAS
jgi:hypothetical protein